MKNQKIKFHKDYTWSKENECRCSNCWKGWCWFNCEYQEWEKANPKLDYFQWHSGELIKKEYKLTSRLTTKGSEPDFLMDFKSFSTDFGRKTMIWRFPKKELWLIDFSWGGWIYYDLHKIEIIKNKMASHGWVCIKEDPQEKSAIESLMDINF